MTVLDLADLLNVPFLTVEAQVLSVKHPKTSLAMRHAQPLNISTVINAVHFYANVINHPTAQVVSRKLSEGKLRFTAEGGIKNV